MRILIIDDDELLCETLRVSLQSENYTVDIAYDGDAGSFMARTNDYDLIIVDGILPKRSGLKVCEEIRGAGKTVPILMLSIQNAIPNKVAVFDRGADDYLTKPFSYEELRARIKALLRRQKPMSIPIITVDDLTIDSNKQRVWKAGKEAHLTKKEFSLLEYLMKNAYNVVSRGMIMEHVWNAEADPFSNTIESHILNLRKKVDTGKTKLIHNVPGRGYKIDIP